MPTTASHLPASSKRRQDRLRYVAVAALLILALLVGAARHFASRAVDDMAFSRMRPVLRMLMAEQERYRSEHGEYAKTLDGLDRGDESPVRFTLREVTTNGFRIDAEHEGVDMRCIVAVGEALADALPTLESGEPRCYRVSRRGQWTPYR